MVAGGALGGLLMFYTFTGGCCLFFLFFIFKVLSMKYSNVQVSTDFVEFCPGLQLSLTCAHFHAQCSCVTAG